MAEPGATAGRIFISYRREETAYPAGWLYDRLVGRYGAGQVFKDVDSIRPGDDFIDVVTRAVGSCDALLALIGKDWLTITGEERQRRLDDPTDFVRVEIEAALTRKVRVIPILVDGARMPRATELPPSLADLVRRQALDLTPARFDYDLARLLEVLDRTLAEVRTEQESASDAPPVRPRSNAAPKPRGHEPPTPQQRADQDKGPGHVSVGQGPRIRSPLVRAWVSVALVPVFLLLASAAASGIQALTETDLPSKLTFVAVQLIPCIAGVVYGRRATQSGVSAGWVPERLAALVGLGWIAWLMFSS